MMLLAMTMIMNVCAMLLTTIILGNDDDCVSCFRAYSRKIQGEDRDFDHIGRWGRNEFVCLCFLFLEVLKQ